MDLDMPIMGGVRVILLYIYVGNKYFSITNVRRLNWLHPYCCMHCTWW